MSGRPRSGVPRYVCPNVPGTDACGGIAANAQRTDDHVLDAVLEALELTDIAEKLRSQDGPDLTGLRGSIASDEAQLEELSAAWAAKKITTREWTTARDIIEGRLQHDRAKFSGVNRTAAIDSFVGSKEDMVRRWEGMNVSQRRAVVTTVLDHVDVMPADRAVRWDPERFRWTWSA